MARFEDYMKRIGFGLLSFALTACIVPQVRTERETVRAESIRQFAVKVRKESPGMFDSLSDEALTRHILERNPKRLGEVDRTAHDLLSDEALLKLAYPNLAGSRDAIAEALNNGHISIAVVASTEVVGCPESEAPTCKDAGRIFTEKIIAESERGLLTEYGGSNFKVIDRAATRTIFEEIAFSQTGAVSDKERLEVGRLTGATHLFIEKQTIYAPNGLGAPEPLTASRTSRLIDVKTGQVLFSIVTEGI